MWRCIILLLVAAAQAKLDNLDNLDKDSEPDDNFDNFDNANDTDTDNETGESGDAWGILEMNEDYRDVEDIGDQEGPLDDDGSDRIGASVTQITRHPYAATLLNNDEYICSAVILNTFWLITESKCFESSVISSYVTHRNLKNYTVRVGSSYNNKGGSLYKITTLINNFDLKITAMKLDQPLEFGSRVQSAKLPGYDEEVTLGYLASIVAWTPVGHMRVVNAPLIEASICDSYTKLLPGHYICLGGVQDINRKFCRKDNGGAVIQNNTLIGVSSFLHSCAIYTRTHAFPRVASFARWLDSVIWDEDNRPTTSPPATSAPTTQIVINVTDNPPDNRSPYFADPRKFMLTLPFDPINVPLEPAGDNSVIPRMSLYESYLQSMARSKTSTTQDPRLYEEQKKTGLQRAWMNKYGGRSVMMMPPQYSGKRYNLNVYN